jgi:hypothetical protein
MRAGRITDRVNVDGSNVIKRIVGPHIIERAARSLCDPDRVLGIERVDGFVIYPQIFRRNPAPFWFVTRLPKEKRRMVAILFHHAFQFRSLGGITCLDRLKIGNRNRRIRALLG